MSQIRMCRVTGVGGRVSLPVPDPSEIGPHRQLVAARIHEVEATPAGKLERLANDPPAALADTRFDVLEIGRVDHDQRAPGRYLRRGAEATGQPAVREARVRRSVD